MEGYVRCQYDDLDSEESEYDKREEKQHENKN